MATKLDEKHLKILRALVQQPENKRCADCLAKGPVYANTNFHTFICTTCSGIHREFGFRVKSISMASFKPEEIKALQEGGNEVARQKWMARWSSSEHPEPDSGDLDRIRSMIRQKYVEKRWLDERGKGTTKKAEDLPRAEPLTNVLGNNIPPLRVENQQNARQTLPSNHQQTPNYQQQQPQQPPQQSRSNVVDFGAFDFQTPPTQPANVQTPFGLAQQSPIPPSQSNGMGDLIFPSSEEMQKRQQEEQQKQKALQLQQALGQMYQQSAYQNQLAMQQYYMQQQMLQMQQMQQLQMGGNQVGVQQNFPPGMQAPVQQTNGIPAQMYVQSPVVQSNGWGVQTAPVTQPSIPIEPEKPAKPDPFAALSPFAMGKSSPMVSSTPKQQQQQTPISNTGDIFGELGVSSTPKTQTNTNSNDPFGLGAVQSQPYGISQSNHVPTPTTNNDFNPFF